MGVSLVDVDSAQEAMMYRVNDMGVYVAQVVAGSAAEQAGMQVGDQIVAMGGVEVRCV